MLVSWYFLSQGLILGMLWAYEELGWGELCADLTVVPVPGDHISLIDPPGVDVIAAHLGGLLEDGGVDG